MAQFDLERALAAPEAVFEHPVDVMQCTLCDRNDKIAILLSWQDSIIALQRASDESMTAAKPGRNNVSVVLAEVTQALTALGYRRESAA